ncbi:MAG: methyl-accepting chemotaxis protein, partial [Chlorobiales bacterium]|nr:methyl-accepting chemotaxis protein [Chlorobiales bacterium]
MISLNSMGFLAGETQKLYNHPYTVTSAILRVDNNIIKMHRSMKDVALATDENGIRIASSSVDEFEKEVFKQFEIINEAFLGDKSQVNAAIKLIEDWKPIRDEVIELMRSGNRAEAAAITKGKGAVHVKKINDAIQGFVEFAQGKADQFVANAAGEKDSAIWQLIIIAVVASVISVGIAQYVSMLISKPLVEAVHVAEQIAEGDLTARPVVKSRDETGRLLQAMQNMVIKLSDIISQSTATSDELAQSASEQASALEEISATMEEINSTTQSNNDSSLEANKLMVNTRDVVGNSENDMEQMGKSMEKIAESGNEI